MQKIIDKMKLLKSYKVSTARKDIKKPLGVGDITAITLNPVYGINTRIQTGLQEKKIKEDINF